MRFGVIGLGRMGSNLARDATEKGHQVIGYDQNAAAAQRLEGTGIATAASLEELLETLGSPQILFLYVPHGDPTESVCQALRPRLSPGCLVADAGNSHWQDSRRRHAFFAEAGIRFLDIGTSGGVSGARQGACFMVGGEREAYEVVAPTLRDLAVDAEGCLYVGPPGAGHFTKLVHNAIEFGMVQAIAEGVELLLRSDYQLDLPSLFTNWMHGSVIRSWLVELMGNALREQTDLGALSTYVEDTGEVKWVTNWATERDIPIPVTSLAQMMLMQYRDLDSPTAKAVALLRNQYGGHPIHRLPDPSRR